MAREQRDFFAVLMLDRPAHELGDQHLIFDGADLEPKLIVEHAVELAGDFRDHNQSTQAQG